MRAVGKGLTFIPKVVGTLALLPFLRVIGKRQAQFEKEIDRQLYKNQMRDFARSNKAAQKNKEQAIHDLARIKTNGRQALIRLMKEKEVLPRTADDKTLNRDAPLTDAMIKFKLKHSGRLNKKMFSWLREQLKCDNPDERKSAANLLGTIVLDSEQEIADDEIRKKAISTLVKTAILYSDYYYYTREGSSESLDMLEQLSFSRDKIIRMERELAARSYVIPSLASKKRWKVLGLGISVGVLAAGMPPEAASIGAIPPLLEVFLKSQKERIRLFFYKRKRKREVPAEALNEVDQFQKLICQRQNEPVAPVYMRGSFEPVSSM